MAEIVIAVEKHYTINELCDLLKMSFSTVRLLVKDEPGVLKFRDLSVSVRRGGLEAGNSEKVASGDPIMPIGDGFSGFFVRSDRRELGKWNCHDTTMPADQDEHLSGAGVFGRHTMNLYSFLFPEW